VAITEENEAWLSFSIPMATAAAIATTQAAAPSPQRAQKQTVAEEK